MKRQVFILVGASWLLAVLLGQLNHYLAPWQIHIWCGGLFVAFAALRLKYRHGAAVCFFSGLLLDAGSPLAFGYLALLFTAAHAVVYNVRARALRDDIVVGVVVALLTNLGLHLALSFLRINPAVEPAQVWVRSFADLVASQIILALISPWYFALQVRLLDLAGANLRQHSCSST